MARIGLVDPARTPFHVKDIFSRVEKVVGVVPNQLRAVANSPDFITPLAATMAVVHRSPGLSARLKELAILKVCKLNGSSYDVAHNTAAGLAAGLSADEIAALDREDGEERFSPAERAVLALAEKITRAPHAIEDADFEPLRGRFSDSQILELVYTIGVYNFTNRLNLALGIELEENFRFGGLRQQPATASAPAANAEPRPEMPTRQPPKLSVVRGNR
jgi:uncharacterized peroxidase-related enzyme